jgi:hypothetical protein
MFLSTKQKEDTMSETIQKLTAHEQSIYGEYRSALRALKNNSNSRESRASDRKQKALKLVADRKRIRISEVKNIVRAGDAANGITHEHTDNYLEDFRIKGLMTAAVEEFTVNPVGCAICGTTDPEALIRPRYDYFASKEAGTDIITVACYLHSELHIRNDSYRNWQRR